MLIFKRISGETEIDWKAIGVMISILVIVSTASWSYGCLQGQVKKNTDDNCALTAKVSSHYDQTDMQHTELHNQINVVDNKVSEINGKLSVLLENKGLTYASTIHNK